VLRFVDDVDIHNVFVWASYQDQIFFLRRFFLAVTEVEHKFANIFSRVKRATARSSHE
jgi:hypothetical protein